MIGNGTLTDSDETFDVFHSLTIANAALHVSDAILPLCRKTITSRINNAEIHILKPVRQFALLMLWHMYAFPNNMLQPGSGNKVGRYLVHNNLVVPFGINNEPINLRGCIFF